MSWIQLRSGGKFDFENPDRSTWTIPDIAWGLAHITRFNVNEVTRADPKPKPDGECPVVGCEKRGGHMGQRWCAGHFQAALRGQVS